MIVFYLGNSFWKLNFKEDIAFIWGGAHKSGRNIAPVSTENCRGKPHFFPNKIGAFLNRTRKKSHGSYLFVPVKWSFSGQTPFDTRPFHAISLDLETLGFSHCKLSLQRNGHWQNQVPGFWAPHPTAPICWAFSLCPQVQGHPHVGFMRIWKTCEESNAKPLSQFFRNNMCDDVWWLTQCNNDQSQWCLRFLWAIQYFEKILWVTFS